MVNKICQWILYGCVIVPQSTVNNCRGCETVTTLLLEYGQHCLEQFKGYLLMYNVLQKLWVLEVVLLCFCKIHIFSIGQEKQGVARQGFFFFFL